MKINEWGVFVERPDTSTYEIKLSEDLATKVYEYIEKLKEDDENIYQVIQKVRYCGKTINQTRNYRE